MRTSLSCIALTLLAASTLAPAMAQSAPALGTPWKDNEKVTIWDINLTAGQSAPVTPHDLDSVILYVEGGKMKVTANGKTKTVTHKFGDAVFVPKGTDQSDTLISGGPAHEVIVALKDFPHTGYPYPNNTKYGPAFPRPRIVKVLDNSKVTVWHYEWLKGQPTPTHFHDKDVVLVYRWDGAVNSVTPDGTVSPNPFKAGEIRFNPGNRTHYEELASDRATAVMMEIK